MPRDATDILGITTGRCEAAYLAEHCPRRTAACRTRCHRHAGYNNGAVRSRLSRGTLQSVNSVLQ